MKLTIENLHRTEFWKAADIALPSYDVSAVVKETKTSPVWVHFGIGNIFRIFIGGIADKLLNSGAMTHGLTCVEAFDYDVVDKIYIPYDNLGISVILHGDGQIEKRVLGSMCESVKAKSDDPVQWNRLKEVFCSPTLQMVSFTITEKGYALKGTNGNYLKYIENDLENGPEKSVSAMAILTSMLLERFRNGAFPLALVSMDNCSQNGNLLRNSVLTVASEWKARGFVDDAFLAFVGDETKVSFPWTMIDKITPRPDTTIADMLEASGVEAMQPVTTEKYTYIAPFINAEGPQYLVIEDNFPNGRPALEKAGVYMTDRNTVNKSERMKVTVCLNPIHSALCTYGCLLGYDLFSDVMKDEDLLRLAHLVGDEGMAVVPDPVILSPKDFLNECLTERFTNPYLGDTVQRIATDISQGLSVRFGETIKSYVEKDGTAASLNGIALAITGWLRYLLAIDDKGNEFELSPDPLNEEMTAKLTDIIIGKPDTYKGQLKEILSNANIFGIDLYKAGIGKKIEHLFCEEIKEFGAVRKTVSCSNM